MIDATNQIFSYLTARWPVGRDTNRTTHWLCSCKCGELTTVPISQLRNGHVKSCGCLQYEWAKSGFSRLRHGQAKRGAVSPEHKIWQGIIKRCTNPNNHKWHRYGGRGITVCERWKIFENFLADMGERPKGLSIDRINNDGNYEPGNCRWATAKVQANNQTRRKG